MAAASTPCPSCGATLRLPRNGSVTPLKGRCPQCGTPVRLGARVSKPPQAECSSGPEGNPFAGFDKLGTELAPAARQEKSPRIRGPEREKNRGSHQGNRGLLVGLIAGGGALIDP
jgi:hypothetical protein